MASALFELAFGTSLARGDSKHPEQGDTFSRSPRSLNATRVLSSVLHEPDDAVLVQQIQSDDRKAFDTLVARYHIRLVGAAESALGTRSEAEDIVQDVLLRIWMHRETWTPVQGAAAYMFGAVTNRVRNVWRDRKRAQHTLEQVRQESEDTSGIADDIAEVWDAVAQLPERWRTAIVLRYLRDASFAEVGQTMHISENAAKKLVQRGIAFLSETLAKP